MSAVAEKDQVEDVKIPKFKLIGPITPDLIRAVRKRMLTPSPLWEEEDRDPIIYVGLGREHDTDESGITYQKCGGGKRVIRKRLGGS